MSRFTLIVNAGGRPTPNTDRLLRVSRPAIPLVSSSVRDQDESAGQPRACELLKDSA